jgi:hypothetical protein
MTRIHVFCEGQTEETFVRELLYEHFFRLNIHMNPIVIRTSKAGKGGVSTYGKIKNQVVRKCKEDTSSWVTTLLDYYALPTDFPGVGKIQSVASSMDVARFVEQSFQKDIGYNHFIANLQIHEFEGLLLSSPDAFGNWFSKDNVVSALYKTREQFKTPEHINDDPETAPSKRILRLCPGYEKVTHGSLIALDIGLDVIRNECPHFNSWLTKLEHLDR